MYARLTSSSHLTISPAALSCTPSLEEIAPNQFNPRVSVQTVAKYAPALE